MPKRLSTAQKINRKKKKGKKVSKSGFGIGSVYNLGSGLKKKVFG